MMRWIHGALCAMMMVAVTGCAGGPPAVAPGQAEADLPVQCIALSHSTVTDARTGRELESTDRFCVGPLAGDSFVFELETTGFNMHTCYVAGRATGSGGLYTYTNDTCTLSIRIGPETVDLADPDGECEFLHCGAQMSLHGTLIPLDPAHADFTATFR